MGIRALTLFRERQDPPLSIEGLAEQLTCTQFRFSRATVSRYESGARKPEPERLPRITEVTGIPASELRPDLAELLNGGPQ